MRFTNFHAYVMNSPKLYATHEDGVIGPDLFRLFSVYHDFQHRKLYLAPNDIGSQAIAR